MTLRATSWILLLAAVIPIAGCRTSRRALRIGYIEAKPYFLVRNGVVSGFVADVFNEAARRQRIPIVWVQSAVAVETALADGSVDVWPLIAGTPERERLMAITAPWMENQQMIVSTRRQPVHGAAELAGKTLVYLPRDVVTLLVRRVLPDARTLALPRPVELLEAVCAGKAGAALMDRQTIGAFLLDRPPACRDTALEIATLAGARIPLGIGSTKAAARDAKKLLEAVTDLATDGTMARLLEQWGIASASELVTSVALQQQRLRATYIGWAAIVLLGVCCALAWLSRQLRRARNAVLKHNELARRTAELDATNQELARKNEENEAFVYIVSHDLRAPLVNLQGFASELERSCRELDDAVLGGQQDPQTNRRVREILRDDIPTCLRYVTASTTKFQRLIHALLTLSRLGRQEYRCEETDVGAVVGGTLDSVRNLVESSGARVSLSDMPRAVGDATAIGQVFGNLVTNALKYLEPGRPGCIEIGGEREDLGMAHYWVKDNGSGIPAAAQPRLFQVFQRFHPDLAPGEGMGLAIVKRVIERHGGRVWAESKEGQGTTFHVTLPTVV